jgi:hypothetical protein
VSWVVDGEPSKAKTEVGNEDSWSCFTDWGLELVSTTRDVGDGILEWIYKMHLLRFIRRSIVVLECEVSDFYRCRGGSGISSLNVLVHL